MRKTKGKPGVMLYFELCDTLQLMSQTEKGDLLDAILAYGKSGIEPQFSDRAMAMIWSRLRFDIQRDGERYEEIRARRMAAANKRWHPEEEMQEDANASDAMQTMPSTTTTATTAPAAATTPAAAASPTAAAAPTSYSAAMAATEPAPGNRSPAPLRANGTHLPDCVAQFVPRRAPAMTPEEFASEKERWKAVLRAIPPETPETPGTAVEGGPGDGAQRSLT